jgi:hypothetical protein
VTGVADESPWPSVTIEAITAACEHPDGRVQLNIELGHVQASLPRGGQSEDAFFHQVQRQVAQALNLPIGRGGSTIHVNVPRDQVEQSVRAIRAAVADFHEVYPSLLAERRSEAERREVESAATQRRLEADQRVIDRVMKE